MQAAAAAAPTLQRLPLLPPDFAPLQTPNLPEPRASMPSEARIEELHRAARCSHVDEFEVALAFASTECSTRAAHVLLMAVAPSSGNSLLHAAAASDAGVGAVEAVARPFTPSRHRLEHAFDLFVWHRNADGDSALHVAARVGKRGQVERAVEMTRAVFYFFYWVDTPSEIDAETEARELALDDDERIIAAALFLRHRNGSGRDAAAEARRAGNAATADWLDAMAAHLGDRLGGLDEEGTSFLEEYRSQLYS